MDEILELKRDVLDVFVEFKVGANQYLPILSLKSRTDEWIPPKLLQKTITELIDEGYIEILDNPLGYRLTEAGAKEAYG